MAPDGATGKVRGLIIAVEEYGAKSGLPALDGTAERAQNFYRWLIGPGGATAADVFFCCSPRVPEARYDATGGAILEAVVDLVDADDDDTAKLFVLHSGHGFQIRAAPADGAVDVVIGSDFNPKLGGFNCFRLQALRNYLQQALGYGVHFYFVDACRQAIEMYVPDLTLAPRTSDLGRSSHNSLFSADDNTQARNSSLFPTAMLAGLRGDGPAKVWQPDRESYWVTFPRVAELLKQRMATQHEVFVEQAGTLPPLIVEVGQVPPARGTVEVRGGGPADSYQLLFTEGPRVESVAFGGTSSPFEVAPGDYNVICQREGKILARLAPPPGTVALYEGTEAVLVFELPSKGRGLVALGDRVTPTIRLPELTTNTTWRINAPVAPTILLTGGQSFDAEAGEYGIELLERGEPIGTTTLRVDRHDVAVALPDVVTPSRIQRALGGGESSTRLYTLTGDVFLPEGRAAEPIADPNPALLLSLVGMAVVMTAAPYHDALQWLENFDDMSPSASAVYVLADDALAGSVAVGDIRRPLAAVDLLDGARHARIDVAAGPHDLHLELDGQGEAVLATHAFTGRVTVVVVVPATGANAGSLSIRQYSPSPGQSTETDQRPADMLATIRFAELVQRRFNEDRDVTTDLEADDLALWETMTEGKWPEPLTAIMAGYEMVRRGDLAERPDFVRAVRALAGQRGSVRAVADGIRELVGPFPDVEILDALASRSVPAPSGTPLVLDGISAAGGRPRPGYLLDYASGWTLFHRW